MNEYKYQYYLQKKYSLNTNMNNILDILCHKYKKRILFVKNIHKYIQIFEYIWIFENSQTSG